MKNDRAIISRMSGRLSVRLRRVLRACALASALLAGGPTIAADLTIGARSELAMDPHFQWLDTNTSYYAQIYGTLVGIDEQSRIVPDLAVSWNPVSPNEWQFALRPGATFHDGSPVTAEAVVASFHRARTLPNASSPYTGAIRTIKEVKATDPSTVIVVTEKPEPTVLYGVAQIQIVPLKLATSATTDDFNTGRAAIGAGPYKFVSYQAGNRLVLERNPTFWGPRPKWDKVTFRFISDDAARVAALLSGDVDLIDFVPPNFVERLRTTPSVTIFSGRSDRVLYLLMDQERDRSPFITDAGAQVIEKNPFKDKRVREALTVAVDRDGLVKRVMNGLAVPTGQVNAEGFGGYNPSIPVPPYDPKRAKDLLAEAGYPGGFGVKLHCTNDRYVNDARICQALGQMFARAGLTIDVQTMPRSVFFPKATDHKGERFSFLLLGWGGSSTGDAGALPNVLHTYDPAKGLGTWNITHYSNAELDRVIESALSHMDLNARYADYAEAMKMAMADYAAIPLYNQSVAVAARKGITYTTWASERTVADSAVPEK
jgi:peptide/nickel transport system substrate-binding protein